MRCEIDVHSGVASVACCSYPMLRDAAGECTERYADRVSDERSVFQACVVCWAVVTALWCLRRARLSPRHSPQFRGLLLGIAATASRAVDPFGHAADLGEGRVSKLVEPVGGGLAAGLLLMMYLFVIERWIGAMQGPAGARPAGDLRVQTGIALLLVLILACSFLEMLDVPDPDAPVGRTLWRSSKLLLIAGGTGVYALRLHRAGRRLMLTLSHSREHGPLVRTMYANMSIAISLASVAVGYAVVVVLDIVRRPYALLPPPEPVSMLHVPTILQAGGCTGLAVLYGRPWPGVFSRGLAACWRRPRLRPLTTTSASGRVGSMVGSMVGAAGSVAGGMTTSVVQVAPGSAAGAAAGSVAGGMTPSVVQVVPGPGGGAAAGSVAGGMTTSVVPEPP